MAKQMKDKVRVYALGGVGESGDNMYVVETVDDIVVMDAGSMLPENNMPGIDRVIPDFDYLIENEKRVRGIFLTHAHEGHIGALPYVLEQLNAPVFGTPLTIGLVKVKLKETNYSKRVKFRTIDANGEIRVGKLKVSFFPTDHSIPESVGICVHTKQGTIVYTGDFKFDIKNVEGPAADLQKLAEIGRKGVLCLLSESTNAQLPGVSESERDIAEHMSRAFHEANGRIVAACTASNIHRIQQVFRLAKKHGRKIQLIGRHLQQVVKTSVKYGHLLETDESYISGKAKVKENQTVLLVSGIESGPVSAVAELLNHKDRTLAVKPGDTVIIADDPIVGNERKVANTIDELERLGADVVYDRGKHGDSSHAFAEELKLMLAMLKPTYFLPVHGEYRMLIAHSRLAKEIGIAEDHIFIAEKGEVVQFTDGEAEWGGKVPSGKVLVDGAGVGDIGNIVLRDRKLLSEDGILLVVVTLGKKTKEILSGPEMISRGFVYVRESEQLLQEASRIVLEVLKQSLGKNVSERSSLKSGIRDSLGKYLFEQTKRRPMILPIIMEVE